MKGTISFPHETHILVKFITILYKSSEFPFPLPPKAVFS